VHGELRYSIQRYDGAASHGDAELSVDGTAVAGAEIRTQPGYFPPDGEGATVGREIDQPVSTSYQPPFPVTGGTINDAVVAVSGSGDGWRPRILVVRIRYAGKVNR